MEIKTLTPEEIQTLDVHAAQRTLLEHSNLIISLNQQLSDKIKERYRVEGELQDFKNTIRVIKSTMSALQTIARGI